MDNDYKLVSISQFPNLSQFLFIVYFNLSVDASLLLQLLLHDLQQFILMLNCLFHLQQLSTFFPISTHKHFLADFIGHHSNTFPTFPLFSNQFAIFHITLIFLRRTEPLPLLSLNLFLLILTINAMLDQSIFGQHLADSFGDIAYVVAGEYDHTFHDPSALFVELWFILICEIGEWISYKLDGMLVFAMALRTTFLAEFSFEAECHGWTQCAIFANWEHSNIVIINLLYHSYCTTFAITITLLITTTFLTHHKQIKIRQLPPTMKNQ